MTDPQRVSNPVEIAKKLPAGAVIIYRHFGQDKREAIAKDLRAIDGLTLLIGNDPDLARAVNADGVHMPRTALAKDIAQIRAQHKGWVITQAAPKDGAAISTQNLDALFVSPIFPSKSPSAGDAIGVEAVSQIVKDSPIPVYALGGVTQDTAPRLIGSGAAGFAAIEGIIKEIVMGEITVEPTRYGHRFVYRKPGHEEAELTMGKIDDRLFDGTHTGVPKSMGGQGVGKALIKVMSDHARAQGYKVIPSCPFIGAMFKRKPSWSEGIWAQ